MILLKKFKTIALTLAAFGFLFSASLSSCGNKKTESEGTENIEQPENAGEHPEEAEHPTDSTEHPAESTGGEHPKN